MKERITRSRTEGKEIAKIQIRCKKENKGRIKKDKVDKKLLLEKVEFNIRRTHLQYLFINIITMKQQVNNYCTKL
jgi:hypothetical protein